MATRLSAVVSRVSQCVYVNQLFTIYHVCQALITAFAAESILMGATPGARY